MISKWENLTRDEIAAIDKDSAIVFLPTAATEQHGPHLPVGTDAIILSALIDHFIATQQFDEGSLIFAPLLNVGKSNEHMGFAGTITYGTQTYYAVLHDIAGAIAKSGFKKLVLFNSHGGNTDMLNMISRDLRIDFGMDVFVFDWWFTSFWEKGLKGLKQSGKYGVFHACELETSLMLHAAPETVHMELAVDEDPVEALRDNDFVTLFGPYNAGWKTSDVTESGVIGAPTYATAEKGKRLFDYAVKELKDIISAFAKTNY
ncbi:creatininase family protein [Sporolactobacillus laevolacticus]|uniref:Creatininase n=1 Tax=Sporolactobacillus laevolacticus DSM 442 TaxID=1395513 RepID=V6IUP9_9BACL|nr:creatininase family protein [Sporolactobacillus laevolacticus]EST10730.1 creatininase [Sporolactobacillus laevolacticus DSM 442]MDN3956023.1 creatininase family protein [Sporolactobacillus laevolacticus]